LVVVSGLSMGCGIVRVQGPSLGSSGGASTVATAAENPHRRHWSDEWQTGQLDRLSRGFREPGQLISDLYFQARIDQDRAANEPLPEDVGEKQKSVRAKILEILEKDATAHAGWGNAGLASGEVAQLASEALSSWVDSKEFRAHVKVVEVRELDKDFRFEKSALGLPISKWKSIAIVVRREDLDRCASFSASAYHEYEGGAKYADAWRVNVKNTSWRGVPCPK
jgi:hypothetical protein